jgi:hypothetical protein
MIDGFENSKRVGRFAITPSRDIFGELTLSGANSSLYLHDKDEFSALTFPEDYIKGTLQDLTKVSLIGCIPLSGTGSGGQQDERYHFATVFPHFAVLGTSYLAPSDQTIAEALFVIDDATTLFYDFDAFGSVIDARPFIEEVANANEGVIHRRVETGADPQILYFSGKREICSVDTVLGKVSASHSPSRNLGGPEGIWLKNTISVSIAFQQPIGFQECIERVSTLLPYLGLLVGRPQNLVRLHLWTQENHRNATLLQVYWCMRPKRSAEHEGPKPHPAEVLLDAVRKREEFTRVLASWLARQEAWRDARSRFFNSFNWQIHYNIDRLVGAANMFDILPDSAVPPNVDLSEELTAAKAAGQTLFGALPESPERNSVLGALGRLGKSSLKQKIRHRAKWIVDATNARLNEITIVTDEAVNCRNHYVHGTEARFDYSQSGMLEFFTDALEFVFATSDLIESGWEIKTWSDKGTTMAHPFGRFLVGYRTNLERLRKLVS